MRKLCFFQFCNDEIHNCVLFAIIVHFNIQKLKNKHTFIQTKKAKSSHFDRTRGDKKQIFPTLLTSQLSNNFLDYFSTNMQLGSNTQCKTVCNKLCNTLCEGQKHSQDLRLPRKRAESHHKNYSTLKTFITHMSRISTFKRHMMLNSQYIYHHILLD